MKLERMAVLVFSVLGMSPYAQADTTRGGEASATIQAMVDYCARVDEEHRHEYLTLGAQTLQSVAAIGDPADYQATYAQVSATLDRMPQRTGRKDCAAAIGAHSDDNSRSERH